ncbi:Zinc transporter SLC39A7 precursor [Zea mays]|uniref:IAA-alanine resistance protein 1 n=2 Tax=Zea mays TaxID=4577 RepID=B4FBL3_MAIZE|nr:Zinc transporter SLC39A7 precursor [Zea mays]ACF79506.1 unknown [Zea mays]ACF84122.1 unknown [Zea mays]ACF84746.1 unknown [Zea mays]ACF87474.1 unknown [Zea mays]ACG34846.1 zinc transporter SLC39A7 [Zea mays]|eukprot:NP_001131198.1 Zinc transporter SLC39A7 precursor [Zea mays]
MRRQSLATVLLLLVAAAALAAPAAGHFESSCPFYDHGGHGEPHERHDHGHSCGGGADHEHHHHHHHGHGHGEIQRLLPEEMAEEADLELESFGYEDHDHGHHHHHHHHHSHGDMETSPMGVWLSAMGCSLLVSMASLVCLVLLPVIFFKGKPSKAIVDSLAVFGAGAMLGDSFLHQLPHAFGGGHSHSHDHEGHDHAHAHEHAHAHSLQDLSVGLSVLFGIVLFFIVEKIVRYVEDNSQNGAHSMGHGHHHHNHKRHDSSDKAKLNYQKSDTDGKDIDHAEEEPSVNDTTGKISDGHESEATIRKRSSSKATDGEATNSGRDPAPEKAPSISNSNLVFGYLNLFSDGVHNFTDGMALGSAFLLHGSVGGWSRTLFLLAHELPQEVGDFGILVRSGFTVSKALFFNFLSALVALAGTALALSLGKDPGHSSLIEGFTAGGFIYIAVAGVLPQMNDQKTTIKSSVAQLISLAMGMLVALGISLVE